MVVITDESTACEIAEALGYLAHRARRAQHIVNVPSHVPSDWDCQHRAIDQLLTDWQARAHI